MILLITTKRDITVDAVIKYLQNDHIPFIRLNIEDFPKKASLTVQTDSSTTEGVLSMYGLHKVKLSEITSCWFRHASLSIQPNVPGISSDLRIPQIREFAKSEKRAFLDTLWKYLDDRFWVNHPTDAWNAEGKLSNLDLARKIGFFVPKTLISNDPEEARKFFYDCKGKVVNKVLGGRVIRKNRKDYVVFTTPIREEDLKRIDTVKYAPTQFQEYIEKKVELRVTIVGEKIFTCEIHSQDSEKTKIDWRHYDFANVKHQTHTLPESIEQKLLQFMKIRRLNYGCFDLILTPNDQYVFIEINPSGEYLWIEELTGMPISKALSDLLREGSIQTLKKLK